ncbi:MAG: hypothetical protein LWX51_16225 [Deltaproteobacteria bacterium]|nr:hypothetical protein [Deltaproteobacteria bacterium]
MKVDVKSEVVQWMLRTWMNRLIDRVFELMLFFIHTATDKHLSGQLLDTHLESLKLNSSEWIKFWMEFFSQKKMIVLAQETADDTHLPLSIEKEAVKNEWLKWLAALDLSDKKNGEVLAKKCYFVGMHLAWLVVAEEMELQSFQNVELVCFGLAVKSSMFIKAHTSLWLKTVSAKHSASHKTLQVDFDREIVKAIYEKRERKNSIIFRTEAMRAINKSNRTVQKRLKEVLEGQ